ncbi:MAG: hypothetical protein EOO14_13465 [Chitinophagaceae bacterium]|nr:MAG: hypothetical protein EOO14_13465 [Chitinophagaceae bacterium]
MPTMIHYASVDDYIAAQPQAVQPTLKKLRKVIKAAVPGGEEVISYCMPAIKKDGIVVWYAAAKKHYALYPKANVLPLFKERLAPYDVDKGTIRFPLDKPIPYDLVKDIVLFRVEENKQLAAAKEQAQSAKKAKPQKV